ncbi:bifunctional glutamate/proline--tRNA ligase-like protein [Leptotrombidium deliense]|uniref:Bifunctional glutamate/proline--tRNA ligase n=1 Tax=Leptotrombidium deliense TaxID=299467 RepID=A0A443SVR4_9ACAR|nr:bifunctional glutamate/proline--tRNA ligase-like protein [Leptotrombidium deliense]
MKPVLGKDDDFKDFINEDSKRQVTFYIEEDAKNLKKSQIIQILRKGYFICDSVFDESTVVHTGVPTPVTLFSVPDGSTDMNIFPKDIQEWKQNLKAKFESKISSKAVNSGALNATELDNKIKEVGDKIRSMKTAKKSKEELKPEIDLLLNLKTQFKQLTGKEWKPSENSSTQQQSINSTTVDSADSLNAKIAEQGNKIRDLKSKKVNKDALKPEIDLLLSLKAKYKELTGKEWTPTDNTSAKSSNATGNTVPELDSKIKEVGDKIRTMKAAKKSKAELQPEIDQLLSLKAKYKELTGQEWKPSDNSSQQSTNASVESADSIDAKIKAQGDKIRNLKSNKTSKEALQPEINQLLSLKAKYKEMTGQEWKPSENTPPQSQQSTGSPVDALDAKIKAQGNKVRELKSQKASQDKLKPEIDCLLKLKEEYKSLAGREWKPDGDSGATAKKEPAKVKSNQQEKKSPPVKEKKEEVKPGLKKQTRLGLEVKKSENLADWYTEVITKAELIEYYDVSGCYILRPWSFAIWEIIQSHFDRRIKKLGVKNCYFPMFVSSHALETEKTHIADFAPEVAWVTKSGSSDLIEPIAIRPTSETVMYPSFAKWVQSHRDLPIKINQWCNVVRWEFKNPTPFLRTREFLWQEGHTAHAGRAEAVEEVHEILEFYREVYEDLLAIPVIKGTKTEKEKFAGGEFTTTIEAYVSANGRGVQAATSHHLGQNFSKMFEITYEDPNKAGNKVYVYQNSWGLSTRSIGVMIMVHSDDKGLVLPPRVAAIQVIIIPCGITVQTTDDEKRNLLSECQKLKHILIGSGIRADTDVSEHNSPGWKYNHWELKGVPIRIELGPKDLKSNQFVAVRRDNGVKSSHPLQKASDEVHKMLADIHVSLFNNALKERDAKLVIATTWPQFIAKLDEKCIILAPFCGQIECEEYIKKNSAKEDQTDASGPLMGAKSLCVPHDQPKRAIENEKCINPNCQHKPLSFTLFGRSY